MTPPWAAHPTVRGGLIRYPAGPGWHLARLPCRWHRCRVAVEAILPTATERTLVQRCACGAIRRIPFSAFTAAPADPTAPDLRMVHSPRWLRWRERNTRHRGGGHMTIL